MPLAFLPVSLSTKPDLVVIDEALRPELLRFKWKLQLRTGHVYRLTGQRVNGQLAECSVSLLSHLTTLPKVYFRNGDCLDFRRANLSPTPVDVPDLMGDTFHFTEDFSLATLELAERLPYYIAESHTWRAQLSLAQLTILLNWVKDNCAYLHMDDTNSAVWAHFKAPADAGQPKLQRPYTRAHLRQLIAGTSSHIPGYDYDALKASRTIGCGRPHHYGQ